MQLLFYGVLSLGFVQSNQYHSYVVPTVSSSSQ